MLFPPHLLSPDGWMDEWMDSWTNEIPVQGGQGGNSKGHAMVETPGEQKFLCEIEHIN